MPREKRWSAIVWVTGTGLVEYQFSAMSIHDAISYVKDNVFDDYGLQINGSSIRKIEILK